VHCADYKNRNNKGNAIDFIAEIWSHYYCSWEKYRHWLNIGALRLLWSWGDCFAKFCVFLMSSVANFLDKNLKVTFSHPEEIPESWTIFYIKLATEVVSLLNITTEQAPRPNPFRIFWAVYFSSWQMYIPHIYQL
jgi:hypothetical protein